MAKKNQLNVSVGVDTKGYKNSWEEAISITQGSGKDIEKEADKMARAVSKKLEGMSVKSQARQLENLVIKMQEAGMAGTKAFTMAATSAGKLKAEIDDAKGIIAAMRPDAPFNALNTTLGASAQAFAGVQGAMALFGGESENVQKTLLKVQAAMAFAEGFKALDGLSDGFQQLNLVIKANPLIAGATIVAGIAASMYALANSVDTAAEASERLNAVQLKVFDSTIKEKTEIGALMSQYNDANTTYNDKLEIQRKLINMSPEYLGGISKEAVETNKVNAAVAGYIQILELKAKAQAYQELYVAELKKEYEATKEVGGLWDKIISGLDPMQMPLSQMQQSAALHGIEAENLLNVYTALTAQVSKLAQEQTKAFGAPTNSPASKSTPKSKVDKYKDPFKNLSTKDLSFTDIKSDTTSVEEVFDKLPHKIQAVTHEFKEYNKEVLAMIDLNDMIAKSIQSLAVNSLQSFSMAMGEMIAGSDTAMQDFGTQLLKSIAAFMQTVSQAMIATAIASDLFQKTLFKQPEIALAAGVALAIGAGIVKQTMSGGVEGKGFAEGGLIGGNSYSGDKLFAPVNSGEVILNTGQQNQLLRMANGGGGSGSLMTSLSRNEFIIWLDKGGSDRRR